MGDEPYAPQAYEPSNQHLAGNTALLQQLSARVAALKACRGAACR